MEGHRRSLTPVVLVLGWAAALAGCAGTPPMATLPVVTEPPGAVAWVAGGAECTTPCSLDVRMDQPVLVNIRAAGYAPVRNILVLRGPAGALALAPERLERVLEPDPESRLAESLL